MRYAFLAIAGCSLLIAACSGGLSGGTPGTTGPEAVKAPRADGTPPVATEALPTTAEPVEATPDPSTPQGAAAEATGATEVADTGPTATVDPTVQALAASFEFPMLGDADAPLKIYEFSDYL